MHMNIKSIKMVPYVYMSHTILITKPFHTPSMHSTHNEYYDSKTGEDIA